MIPWPQPGRVIVGFIVFIGLEKRVLRAAMGFYSQLLFRTDKLPEEVASRLKRSLIEMETA